MPRPGGSGSRRVDPRVVIHRGHLHRPAAPEMEHRRDALGRGAKGARVREIPVHEFGSKAAQMVPRDLEARSPHQATRGSTLLGELAHQMRSDEAGRPRYEDLRRLAHPNHPPSRVRRNRGAIGERRRSG
jgi:hypothetical protein